MINYLGQDIPNLSQISYPLCNLLKKGISWHWSHKHSTALKEIQTILTAEPVPSFSHNKCLIEIQFDATSHGLGVCLMQKKSPIYYSSRSLKLVSAIFYQIFIFSPNDSPSKTMKNVFYFI